MKYGAVKTFGALQLIRFYRRIYVLRSLLYIYVRKQFLLMTRSTPYSFLRIKYFFSKLFHTFFFSRTLPWSLISWDQRVLLPTAVLRKTIWHTKKSDRNYL